ncbi:MAG: fibronectin type III domain-containing protein [Bacteroidales bacterium]|jgi:hypothetical protein|nr:fibronectin type III domain-containing protein [Bacteroidales bacterium]
MKKNTNFTFSHSRISKLAHSLLLAVFLVPFTLCAQQPPASLQILENDYHTAKLSVMANTGNDNILIAITDVPKKNAWNQIIEGGTFGTPTGNYQIGDEIAGGGTVVYIGGTSNNIVISDLTDNVIYHFQAWSKNSTGIYSANYLTADFLTWGKVPFVSDYALCILSEPPFGWNVGGTYSIFMQETSWGAYLQTDELNGIPSNPAVSTLTTQWILLENGRSQLHFKFYMNVSTFGPFYNPITAEDWIEGSFFDIQLSTDDVNYVTVHTVNKNNAPDFAGAPNNISSYVEYLTPEFDNFNGQKAKVRLKWNLLFKARTYFTDIHIEKVDIGECEGVYNLAVNPNSLIGGKAEISWNSYDEDADLWEIRYRIIEGSAGEWTEPVEISENPYLLTELPFETKIEIQVRTKCSPELFSNWASSIFTTGPEFPPCAYPVELIVEHITPISVLLSWKEGNEDNLGWELRYRDATTTSWINVYVLETKTHLLEELTPNTVYVWTVRANCAGNQFSSWATQNTFTTKPFKIENFTKEITVFASGKLLNIINTENRYIENIQLFDITGKLISEYIINSVENVQIQTNLSSTTMVFVKIVMQNGIENQKIIIP